MATVTPEGVYSLPAAADFRAVKQRFAVRNGSGQLALAGSATAKPIGVYDNNYANAGEPARYLTMQGKPHMKVEAGGTIAAEAEITSDSTGRAVAAASGNLVHGIAEEAAVVNQVMAFQPVVPYTKA